jgi:hypothetical protein
MPPALDQATTLPSVSVIVTVVLLNDAWMCASRGGRCASRRAS